MLKKERPHGPVFDYVIFSKFSLLIYKDLIEYSFVGDEKRSVAALTIFLSQLKATELLATGQYVDYQTFTNLKCIPLLKSIFHCFDIELRDTEVPKNTLGLSSPHLSCFDVYESLQTPVLTSEMIPKNCFRSK